MKYSVYLFALALLALLIGASLHTPNDMVIDGSISSSSLSANTLIYSATGGILTSMGTVASGTNVTVGGMQASVFKSSDGTAGITTNITAGLVTFTIKSGLIVGVSL